MKVEKNATEHMQIHNAGIAIPPGGSLIFHDDGSVEAAIDDEEVERIRQSRARQLADTGPGAGAGVGMTGTAESPAEDEARRSRKR